MNILEAIKNRRSVRTFDGTDLSRNDAEKILNFAAKTGNPYGIPIEWRVLHAKEHGLSSPVITAR